MTLGSKQDSLRPMAPQERKYRNLVHSHLNAFRMTVQETDLGIYADHVSKDSVRESVLQQRSHIETYIQHHPEFAHTLRPVDEDPLAPPIVRDMITAGAAVGVGPMAAVAGAVAERVGRSILQQAAEVVLENGGDIFLEAHRPLTIGIYAGTSPLSLKIGLRVTPNEGIRSVCTSSGTVGHSLSLGRADAVCVLGGSCALADAAATALGNRVDRASDITQAIEWGRSIPGVLGVLIIVGEKMGAWGQLEIVPLT